MALDLIFGRRDDPESFFFCLETGLELFDAAFLWRHD